MRWGLWVVDLQLDKDPHQVNTSPAASLSSLCRPLFHSVCPEFISPCNSENVPQGERCLPLQMRELRLGRGAENFSERKCSQRGRIPGRLCDSTPRAQGLGALAPDLDLRTTQPLGALFPFLWKKEDGLCPLLSLQSSQGLECPSAQGLEW